MRQILLAAVSALAASTLVSAESWKLDKAHSSVHFSIRHMVISEVIGKFNEFDVTLTSSNEDFTDAVIEAVVYVKSIDTEVANRDNHLKSDDFFSAEKFPEMRFKTTSIAKTGENQYRIIGDLTIRDITREVTFSATLLGVIDGGKMGKRAGWKATTTINRFDYNLKWDRMIESGGLVAGKDVTIMLNLEFMKEQRP